MSTIKVDCQSVQEDLSVGAVSDDARRHLETCGNCQTFEKGIERIDRQIHIAANDLTSSALKSNIARAIDRVPAAAPRRFGRKAAFFLGWASVLVILMVTISRMNQMVVPHGLVRPAGVQVINDKLWHQIVAHSVGQPIGDPKSQYSVVLFGDFACPQCAAMHQQLVKLPATAPVRLYFVNRPFPKIRHHENAMVAAEAGCAAAAQGKFWPMYNALYQHHDALDPSHYEAYANAAGLDGARLRSDVDGGKYRAEGEASMRFCDDARLDITPTIIVRDNQTGGYSVASGRDQINRLLPKLSTPSR